MHYALFKIPFGTQFQPQQERSTARALQFRSTRTRFSNSSVTFRYDTTRRRTEWIGSKLKIDTYRLRCDVKVIGMSGGRERRRGKQNTKKKKANGSAATLARAYSWQRSARASLREPVQPRGLNVCETCRWTSADRNQHGERGELRVEREGFTIYLAKCSSQAVTLRENYYMAEEKKKNPLENCLKVQNACLFT